MTDPKPQRIPAVTPTRAITYTTDDPNQQADPATDPHAVPPKKGESESDPVAEAPAEEAPAGKRGRKTAE